MSTLSELFESSLRSDLLQYLHITAKYVTLTAGFHIVIENIN